MNTPEPAARTRFALIGAAGYIAPRHLKAIKDSGGELVAALDPFDSVGVMDASFPDAEFFTQPEQFESHLHDLRRQGRGVDYVSICSPNHLHDAHIRLALRAGADALCEKPLVLHAHDIHALKAIETETGRRVWTVLQLRTHSALLRLKADLDSQPKSTVHDVDLSYVTSRGVWYRRSWKGRTEQSGGLASNIGVHFFDLLNWLFGEVRHAEVHARSDTFTAGYLELERARVRWFLSVDVADVPQELRERGQRTYRSIALDGGEIEFSEGFTDLHTAVYGRTLEGQGFGLDDALDAIETVSRLRSLDLSVPTAGRDHPFLSRRGGAEG